MRKTPTLTPLKSHNIPKYLAFFDTETYIDRQPDGRELYPLRLGCLIIIQIDEDCNVVSRKEYRFDNTLTLLITLLNYPKDNHDIYLFAHNIPFDIIVTSLPKQAYLIGLKSSRPILDQRMFIWTIAHYKGNIICVDTSNFGVISVKDIGAKLNRPKLTINFDTCSDDELYHYCRNDVEIIMEFMLSYLSFIKRYNLGKFKLTLASQAMTAYRTTFMKRTIYLHDHYLATKLERDSYHGGRVECYFIGEKIGGEFYDFDVNSMYPYVMSSYKMPTKLVGYDQKTTIERLEARLTRQYCIAKVRLKTSTNAYPYYDTHKNKLLFPVGEYETVLHKPELLIALKNRDITQVISCATYDEDYIFKEYVSVFSKLKAEFTLSNNHAWREITKLFLNSLYGKFGELKVNSVLEKRGDYDIISRMSYVKLPERYKGQVINWFGNITLEYKKGNTSHSFAAIAGAITAYARITLFNYIKQAGSENVFYTDTDSLITNKIGATNLSDYIDETKLGLLKVVATSPFIRIHNSKDYEFGYVKHIKGVPISATLDPDNKWTYMQFLGFKTWLNQGGIQPMYSFPRKKTRKTSYNKGIVEASTGHVKPFTFSDFGG